MLIKKEDKSSVGNIVEALGRQEICILPCDTIYGLCGLAPATNEKITNIKGREEDKPLIILANEKIANSIFKNSVPPEIKKYWPGPLTVIGMTEENVSQAVRVPDDEFLLNIINGLGYPIYSTSVNRSGKPFMNDIKKIIEEFKNEVSIICDAGKLHNGKPSTIIDICSRPFKLIRQGECLLPENLFF